ncbi:MAG: DUF5320 domain-containing protein [Verrucomicrobia bacterium]|nr:DUF5320 domain-containing protein [Verrucomicrobiota bacterium]MBT7064743.1 DUF5320 domain-containing protein [Verrucomicrobiota bacterium]MBT7699177.1 DUF5320 domain-containing protein [Verrucomicrobiota bacterium]
MPRGDKTGPMGQGPMTGGGFGSCAQEGGQLPAGNRPRLGRGRGRGGRGRGGRGRGRGFLLRQGFGGQAGRGMGLGRGQGGATAGTP